MEKQSRLKAVLFDLDGVIIQSCKLHELAWQRAGSIHGFRWSSQINYQKEVYGTSSPDSAKLLFGKDISNVALEHLISTKDLIYGGLLQEEVRNIVVPGFIDFFNELKGRGYKVALVTSALKEEAEFVLKNLNIFEKFTVRVDQSPKANKANPDHPIYIKALSKLNLDAKECLVFGYSISGIKAANNAGLRCVLVQTALDESKAAALQLKVDYSINYFFEISADIMEILFASELQLLQ